MKLINEKPISFIELFKNLDLVRSYNSIAGINQNIVVKFYDDPKNSYGQEFSDYATFKKFCNEEYNNAKDLLATKFIIGEPFFIQFFGENYEYFVDLIVE